MKSSTVVAPLDLPTMDSDMRAIESDDNSKNASGSPPRIVEAPQVAAMMPTTTSSASTESDSPSRKTLLVRRPVYIARDDSLTPAVLNDLSEHRTLYANPSKKDIIMMKQTQEQQQQQTVLHHHHVEPQQQHPAATTAAITTDNDETITTTTTTMSSSREIVSPTSRQRQMVAANASTTATTREQNKTIMEKITIDDSFLDDIVREPSNEFTMDDADIIVVVEEDAAASNNVDVAAVKADVGMSHGAATCTPKSTERNNQDDKKIVTSDKPLDSTAQSDGDAQVPQQSQLGRSVTDSGGVHLAPTNNNDKPTATTVPALGGIGRSVSMASASNAWSKDLVDDLTGGGVGRYFSENDIGLLEGREPTPTMTTLVEAMEPQHSAVSTNIPSPRNRSPHSVATGGSGSAGSVSSGGTTMLHHRLRAERTKILGSPPGGSAGSAGGGRQRVQTAFPSIKEDLPSLPPLDKSDCDDKKNEQRANSPKPPQRISSLSHRFRQKTDPAKDKGSNEKMTISPRSPVRRSAGSGRLRRHKSDEVAGNPRLSRSSSGPEEHRDSSTSGVASDSCALRSSESSSASNLAFHLMGDRGRGRLRREAEKQQQQQQRGSSGTIPDAIDTKVRNMSGSIDIDESNNRHSSSRRTRRRQMKADKMDRDESFSESNNDPTVSVTDYDYENDDLIEDYVMLPGAMAVDGTTGIVQHREKAGYDGLASSSTSNRFVPPAIPPAADVHEFSGFSTEEKPEMQVGGAFDTLPDGSAVRRENFHTTASFRSHPRSFGQDNGGDEENASGASPEHITKQHGERSMKWKVLVGVAAIIVLVAVVVVIVIGLGSGGDDDGYVVPTSEERYDSIKARLEDLLYRTETDDGIVAPRSVFDSPSSAQSRALQWLSNEDQAHIEISDQTQTRLVARYVLALLYFATQGDTKWQDKSSFLSPRHECDWTNRAGGVVTGGIQCDPSTLEVSRLSLGKSMMMKFVVYQLAGVL